MTRLRDTAIEGARRKTAPNKSLQATRDGVSSSAFADYVINPACLSSLDRNERNMLELSRTSPPWYRELGFDKPTDTRGRSSIADLFCRRKPRTGIYLLGYSDSTHYIGQAVDVVRRFGGHRRLSSDIESFAFISTRRASLDEVERNAIHDAEAFGVRLRNRVHVADVIGPVDLDELVPEDSQNRWLNDPGVEISDAAEPVMLPPDSPQRWRTDQQFRQLAALPEYASVLRIVADYIGSCIVAPATTQLSYWSLTALPSTNKLHHPRFGCLSVNMMEVLVCG